jgi:hypothetical protein
LTYAKGRESYHSQYDLEIDITNQYSFKDQKKRGGERDSGIKTNDKLTARLIASAWREYIGNIWRSSLTNHIEITSSVKITLYRSLVHIPVALDAVSGVIRRDASHLSTPIVLVECFN